MRVVTNEALIDRNRKIAHILFFLSLAGMGVGFFYSWSGSAEASSISCLLLPSLLLMTIASVRMANTWIREPRPFRILNESLKGVGHKYTIFHYVLPAHHVLIGPEGVFTIKAVWQERPYRVKGGKWYGDNGLARRIMGYMRQDLIGNPFRDARYEASQVQKVINKIAPDSGVEVQPLVVFVSPRAEVEIEDPTFPVLYADSKKKPSLRNYLRDLKNEDHSTLSTEAMDQIDVMYGLITRQELESALSANGYEYEEDEESEVEPVAETGVSMAAGRVFIVQSGQLYHIGASSDSEEAYLTQLQEDTSQPVELIRTIESGEPAKLKSMLHKKFATKRQKGEWFGLSKKDITWLRSFEG